MILKNLRILISTYKALLKDVKLQRLYVRKILEPEIRNAEEYNDGTLDEEDFDKIRNYYGFGVPAIVGEGICTLRGKPMSGQERFAAIYQGALTGLYDDFFDKSMLNEVEIKKMMQDPYVFVAASSLEQLFIHFLIQVHENLPDKKIFNLRFARVFDAQVESKKQASAEMSIDNIKEITFNKGGNSLLYYRSIFEHEPVEGEEEAMFHAGALMQLGNDIFDVYEDERDQIRTLLTSCEYIDSVRVVFLEQMGKTIDLIQDTAFEKKDIRKYLQKFVLGISRCFVCLDQLERLQKKTGGRFVPSAYSREELICDMEKPANIFRSLKYFTGYKF